MADVAYRNIPIYLLYPHSKHVYGISINCSDNRGSDNQGSVNRGSDTGGCTVLTLWKHCFSNISSYKKHSRLEIEKAVSYLQETILSHCLIKEI